MSNTIGRNEIYNFFIDKYDSNRISFDDVKDLGIDVEKYVSDDTDGNREFDIDEISNDKDFYAAITVIVEKEKEALEADAEKEKEENEKVQSSGNAKNK